MRKLKTTLQYSHYSLDVTSETSLVYVDCLLNTKTLLKCEREEIMLNDTSHLI